jgi:hypothetical protein
VSERPEEADLREMFFRAVLDEVATERSQRGAVGDDIAREILAAQEVATASPRDVSTTTPPDGHTAAPDASRGLGMAPAIFWLAAGFTGLVRSRWLRRSRADESVSGTEADAEPGG